MSRPLVASAAAAADTTQHHPLADLDGKRKYIFSKDREDFYLRVITSCEEMAKYPHPFLGPVMHDAATELDKELHKRGERLKTAPISSVEEIVEYQKFVKTFDREDNQTAFIVENKVGEPAVGMLIFINDPVQRRDLKVADEVGTFVYVSDIMTADKYRGKGIFSTAFDKILTMMSNEKRGFKHPFEYSISMTRATSVKDSGESETEYVMNLPRYAEMWKHRFPENELQNRWQYRDSQSGENKIIGLNRMPLEEYLRGGKINEAEIDRLMKHQMVEAEKEGKEVRGLYLAGHSRESHAEVAAKRKALLAKREVNGVQRVIVKKTSWEVPGVSPAVVGAAQSHCSGSHER